MFELRMLCILFLVGTTVSTAHADRVAGTVAATRSRWSAEVIVTESKVIGAHGEAATAVQLGGVVDGIGMWFSHQPAILQAGDAVALEVRPGSPTVVALSATQSSTRVNLTAAAPSVATYAVQRTQNSNVSLWRDNGCIDMVYDAATVPADAAHVLDEAFATWTAGTTGCGGVSFTTQRRPDVPTARDDLNTLHIRSDRWCRPASGTEPELCYAPDAAAVTRLVYVDSLGDADDGKILEADLELNAVNFVLLAPGAVAPPTTKPVLDLLSVATHEVGHVLGLAHDCGSGLEAWPLDDAGRRVPACAGLAPDSGAVLATMYYRIDPGTTSARTLESSDVAGACTLLHDLACQQTVEGGCSAGGAGASGSAWLSLLGLVAMRRRSA